MSSIGKQICPCCGQSINKREISLFKELVEATITVYKYCKERPGYFSNEFERKEIKHLLKSENATARFGDIIYFGGIVYKKEKGKYGFNTERMEEFLRGELKIPTKVLKDPLKNTIEKSDYRRLSEIKGLSEFLDENQDFMAQYWGTANLF